MQLQSPSRENHLETLAHIFGVTFSNYWDRRRYVYDGYIEQSDYDWDASRIGVVDGEVATHFGVWDRQMRIGSAAVRIAAIGAVATLEPYRKKGLMAETVAGCVAGMPAAGYDLSMLFGIPGFYHRFGYVRSFGEGTFRVNTRDLAALGEPPEMTDGPEDIDELASLYNKENADLTGTWVRPTYGTNRKPSTVKLYRFDSGYVYLQHPGFYRPGEEIEVVDCVGDPEQILAIAVREARKHICPTISLPFLPPRSRLGEYLIAMKHRYEMHRDDNGGPMFKIVNLESTTRKLLPVLTQRLSKSGRPDYDGLICLTSDSEAVEVTIRGGEATDCKTVPLDSLDQEGKRYGLLLQAGVSLVRLFVGDDHTERIISQGDVTVSGSDAWLVPVLFPHQEPSTILWDRF